MSAVSRRGVLVILALGGLAWWLVFRFWMMQGDDFMSATIGGARGGHFTFQAWANDSWRDYWQATGRQSGSLFRIVLRGGPEVVRWAMTAQQVGVAAVLLLWSRSTSTPPPVRWAFALAAVCAVPILGWRDPGLHGAALVWAQASFDYVVSPVLCLVLVGSLVLGTESDERWSWPRTLGVTLLAVVAPLLHETGSLATLASVVVLVVVQRARARTTQPRVRTLLIVATVSAVVQATAPGMWKRLGAVTGTQPAEAGPRLLLLRAANTCWQVGATAGAVVLVVSGLLTVAAVVGRGWRSRLTAFAVVHVLGMGTAVLACRQWSRWPSLTSYGFAMTAEQLGWATVFLGSVVVASLAALVMAGSLVDHLGPLPVVALAGAAGSFMPPLLAGITATRALLPLTLWLLALAFAVLGGWAVQTSRAVERRLAAGALVLVLGLSSWAVPLWWWRTWTGLRDNAAAYGPVLAQIERARAGQVDEVVFPRQYPHPELIYYYAFRLDRYAPMIRAYYDLPDSVRLVQQP
ncbi:hypothetical protein [Aestuariimicrobium kwangyangense]|uniref:hypothetical protein n=1 Tax=Aestuariimicrobium kwangyangense TaxID=396389 RepID=UPI0003B3EA64|nr:hypothetical protein [Aestuariimicrobium kwangyangense]